MYTMKQIPGINNKELEILNKLAKKQNGAYFRIQYMTDINSKVSARFKSYNISKITEMSVRKGINYENLKSVIEEKQNLMYSKREYTPWYSHVDKMLLKSNKKDQYYVALFPNKFGTPKTIYMINGERIEKTQLKELGIMQPSYWNRESEKPKMITLGLDKIINVF